MYEMDKMQLFPIIYVNINHAGTGKDAGLNGVL